VQPAHRTQIFIAGGGTVGLTAAIELQRRGFSPRIVDPGLEVSPQSRALAINPGTLDLLDHRVPRKPSLPQGTVLKERLSGIIRHRFSR
jgi:2-polyprenyl-6-methoxyphenol hydroxylase-like FAD-dependent oxidoreductase